jgi:regulator of RNase E activity RraA
MEQFLRSSLKAVAYSAVLADILDSLGYSCQILPPHIRPVWNACVVVGTARTILVQDVATASAHPYDVEFSLVDDLRDGDVVVAQCGAREAAFWGELLSTAAEQRGSSGAVIDGFCRDIRQIQELGFPVFARGMSPADSKGRCESISRDIPIQIGGVMISSGDLVFADADGVVITPTDLIEEVARKALEKVSAERTVFNALKAGMSTHEAFDTWGIL